VEKSLTEDISKTPKLNIVCTLKHITGNDAATTADIDKVEAEYEIERQRGTWNKDVIKWWIKGEVDEFFKDRENYLKRVLNCAFTEWDIEIPIKIIRATSEEDADLVMEFGRRQNDPYYPNNPNVLAYAGYPDGALKGYMKIFTNWQWNVKGNLNFLSMIIHEFGHILGRPHSERKLWKDIMDPSINARITELSDHDILGATTEYGVRVYSSDTGHDRLEKANRHGKERLKLVDLPPIAAVK